MPIIDPSDRQGEHAKLAAAWRENPKSYTAQEQGREKKRAEALKTKKGKVRGKKCSAEEAFKEEKDAKLKAETKEEMVLVSELDTMPPFLAGISDSTRDAGRPLSSR